MIRSWGCSGNPFSFISLAHLQSKITVHVLFKFVFNLLIGLQILCDYVKYLFDANV